MQAGGLINQPPRNACNHGATGAIDHHNQARRGIVTRYAFTQNNSGIARPMIYEFASAENIGDRK